VPFLLKDCENADLLGYLVHQYIDLHDKAKQHEPLSE